MEKLDFIERFDLPHGTVFTVHSPREMDRGNPEIVGECVEIDGDRWIVHGVECHMPAFPIRAGEVIGLGVKPLKLH